MPALSFKSRKEAMSFVKENSSIIDLIIEKPYTMVKITFSLKGQIYHSIGFAKQCWKDPYSQEVGVSIAHGRAIAKIAKKLYNNDELSLASFN